MPMRLLRGDGVTVAFQVDPERLTAWLNAYAESQLDDLPPPPVSDLVPIEHLFDAAYLASQAQPGRCLRTGAPCSPSQLSA